MANVETAYEHIILTDDGTPVIEGANTKVIEVVVLPVRAWGISPEQLHLELPHLSLGQIYSALAYYCDHKKEIDADIRKRRDYVDRVRKEPGQPPITDHLLALRGG